jgi:nitrate reductase delta subunit
VWQSASLLLGYPDEQLLASLPIVRRLVRETPSAIAEAVLGLADYLEGTALEALQEAYVATFDNRRRCTLFLTYFAYGDTRKRGVALLRFKQTYLRSGVALDEGELPDHLCVVLEYAATVDRERGWDLLLDHRAGLELLRLALLDCESPWAAAVGAVCATLPALRGDAHEAIQRLAVEGPPTEEVGLADGMPAFDPALVREPVELPMPTLRGTAR